MHDPILAHRWAHVFLTQLRSLGVERVCIAPGSRSTVLAIQAARIFDEATMVHFDERGLAFFALGAAKASRAPTCIITTSGTAVANVLPAVVEAHQAHVPLIVISADRPPELRDRGSNQTIDQNNIFGAHVSWYIDIPCATPDIPLDVVRDWAAQAWDRSGGYQPVHVNWMFREPFLPEDGDIGIVSSEATIERVSHRCISSTSNISALLSTIEGSRRGVCVVGELENQTETEHVRSCVGSLGWVTLADSLSNLRCDTRLPTLVSYGDLALLEELPAALKPDTVLFFGGRIVSKRISALLKASSDTRVVAISSRASNINPLCGISERFVTEYGGLSARISSLQNNQEQSFVKSFVSRGEAVASALESELSPKTSSSLSEPSVLRAVARLAPAEHVLMLGNSMPIRDFDMFAAPRKDAPYVVANRGASGIDGVVATAFGASYGLRQACTLVVGDLSLLHDLNSLSFAREVAHSVTIVVINNNGGGIFSLLPVAQQPSFERYFGAPHGVSFDNFARSFGISYSKPATFGEFERAYRDAVGQKGTSLIEVVTDRTSNAELHRLIQTRIKMVLS